MENPESIYSDLLRKYSLEYTRYQKNCRLLVWLRLIAFLGIALFFYFALTSSQPALWFSLSGLCMILMLFLIKIHSAQLRKREYTATLVSLCEKEQKALCYEFLEFPDGADFMQTDHAFSSDIDLFGPGSFFQYVNRTVTSMGRSLLASWLSKPEMDPEEIRSRQQACRELSQKTEWRLRFAATGYETESSVSPESLKRWLGQSSLFRNHEAWIRTIAIWQVVMTLLTVATIAGWINYGLLVLMILLNLGISGFFLRQVNQVARVLGKSFSLLENYTGLIGILQEVGFRSGWMTRRTEKLFTGKANASDEIKSLRKLLQRFDSRNNLLIGFTRNALFLSDLQLVLKMEIWRNRNASQTDTWLEILGETDALSSLATFAYNNPSYVYPIPLTGEFSLIAKDMGHPLIPSGERVCNDFSLRGWHSIVVLTGANMAGKSTFLRTVGLNHILAHTGAPVCAIEYSFTPVSLITSIRTNDSLIKHESYFYAELKKLKSIMDALNDGRELFILLDEVLKGTNSNDKLGGSIILLRRLIGKQVSGIIATHDIALGELDKEFPDNIHNYCFEADISEGGLSFNYRLRPGIAQNMTALFLMKQMGIV